MPYFIGPTCPLRHVLKFNINPIRRHSGDTRTAIISFYEKCQSENKSQSPLRTSHISIKWDCLLADDDFYTRKVTQNSPMGQKTSVKHLQGLEQANIIQILKHKTSYYSNVTHHHCTPEPWTWHGLCANQKDFTQIWNMPYVPDWSLVKISSELYYKNLHNRSAEIARIWALTVFVHYKNLLSDHPIEVARIRTLTANTSRNGMNSVLPHRSWISEDIHKHIPTRAHT